jgi:hypothetical protein
MDGPSRSAQFLVSSFTLLIAAQAVIAAHGTGAIN